MRLEERLSALEQVAEAAREFERAYQDSLGSVGHREHVSRKQDALRSALAGLGADTQESGV